MSREGEMVVGKEETVGKDEVQDRQEGVVKKERCIEIGGKEEEMIMNETEIIKERVMTEIGEMNAVVGL